jgi:hypothetical protein
MVSTDSDWVCLEQIVMWVGEKNSGTTRDRIVGRTKNQVPYVRVDAHGRPTKIRGTILLHKSVALRFIQGWYD